MLNVQSRRLIGAVVSVLLIFVLGLLFTDSCNTLRDDGKRIVLSNPADVNRIVLSDQYDSTELIRKGEEWYLFGVERVNPVTVENLLFAAQRLQISSIVTDIPPNPASGKRKIKYLNGEKIVMAYTFQKRGDQYMVNPDRSDQNFLVSIAGYPDLQLDRVFSSSVDHFREHLLMELLPSEISQIDIELANGEAFQFTQHENGHIECSPVNHQTILPSRSLNELSTRLLFSYFTSIRYEEMAGISGDSLFTNMGDNGRMATIHVVSFHGEEHTIQVYPYQVDSGEKAHLFQALVSHNNSPELLVVNYIYLDVLMRDLSHYYGEK